MMEGKQMRIPEDFRYQSSLKEFKESVGFLVKELENKKAHLLYGCINNIFVEISDERNEITSIIMNEVISLLEDVLTDSFDLENLNSYLEEQCLDGTIEENDKEEILRSVEEKYKYVAEKLISEEMINRYYFKTHTVNQKLIKIQSDINKYIIDDNRELKYAHIKMVSNQNVPEYSYPYEIMRIVENKAREVEFICDIEDVDYIIKQLEIIKQKLK